jgi:hypothetical protein
MLEMRGLGIASLVLGDECASNALAFSDWATAFGSGITSQPTARRFQ